MEARQGSNSWTPGELACVDARLGGRPAEDLLVWAVEAFAPDLCLASSFGPQSIVLMHMLSTIDPTTTVFYLDTDLLFAETYELRDRLREKLRMTITRVPASLTLEQQAAGLGPELWTREPDRCCHVRKVLPLRRFLASRPAWITGIRAAQTAYRARAARIQWDESNRLVKLNPLLDWTTERVWAYIHAHDLPFNPLHLAGFPSVGCRPCTRSVQAGEDARAGRWAGFAKTECGIHASSANRADKGAV
jgi:phosphoadenosine phosphosulfate reductase